MIWMKIITAKNLRIDVQQLTWKTASPRPIHPITNVLLSMYPKIFSRHPISNTSLSQRLHFSFCFSQHSIGKFIIPKNGCQSSGPQIPQHLNWKKGTRTHFLKLFTNFFPFTSFWTFAHSFSYFPWCCSELLNRSANDSFISSRLVIATMPMSISTKIMKTKSSAYWKQRY